MPHFEARGGGSIVTIASVSGSKPGPCSQYGAAEAGEIFLTGALAWELAPTRIRANTVSPGLIGVVIQDDDDLVRCLAQKTVADSTGSFTLNTLAIPSVMVLTTLQALLGSEDHVLYVEVGPVTDPTVSFGPVS